MSEETEDAEIEFLLQREDEILEEQRQAMYIKLNSVAEKLVDAFFYIPTSHVLEKNIRSEKIDEVRAALEELME